MNIEIKLKIDVTLKDGITREQIFQDIDIASFKYLLEHEPKCLLRIVENLEKAVKGPSGIGQKYDYSSDMYYPAT